VERQFLKVRFHPCSVSHVEETRRALLLIADIGGYTEYMRSHRTILGHAEAATRRLLEKVVDAARDFDLIEIEGDAAFLSREAGALDGDAMLA
jgi:HD superfamily phosphodiesterase